MVDLVEKAYLYLIVGVLVQILIFQDVDGGHLAFICLNGRLGSNRCQNQSPSG